MAPVSACRLLLTLGLALWACTAAAASRDVLLALRDAAVADECDTAQAAAHLGKIHETELPDGGGTLYLVPCRSTAFDIVSVAVLERNGHLRALVFPDPVFARKGNWSEARMARIAVTSMLLSPAIAPARAILTTSARIPPGLGMGVVEKSYRIEHGMPELLRYAILLDGRAPIVLWQAP